VLHALSGGGDGGNPAAGLALDRASNLYGTTAQGGNNPSACLADHAIGISLVSLF